MAVSTIPHGLELVVDFVNTRDGEQEDLAGPGALAGWLATHETELGLGRLAPLPRRSLPAFGDAELRAALALRESLRATMAAHNGGPADVGAAHELELVAERGALAIGFDEDGAARILARDAGFDGVLAGLLAPVARATADGSWQRVKACGSEPCQWAFYDRSRNRSGRWCAMATCGNREKVRAYRERRGG